MLFNVFGETPRILSSLSGWTALGWPLKASVYRLFLRWILIWHALRRWWCQTRQFVGFLTHQILQSVESSTALCNTVVPTNISSMSFLLHLFYMSLVLLIEWTSAWQYRKRIILHPVTLMYDTNIKLQRSHDEPWRSLALFRSTQAYRLYRCCRNDHWFHVFVPRAMFC